MRRGASYDGLCYNTALVAAGLVPLEGWSLAVTPMESLLGMESEFLSLAAGSWSVGFRASEGRPYLLKTLKWSSPANELAVRFPLEAIRGAVEPGSILCYRKRGATDFGARGFHCLTFVGEDWIIESDGPSEARTRTWEETWTEQMRSFRKIGGTIEATLFVVSRDWSEPLPGFRDARGRGLLAAVAASRAEIESFYERYPLGSQPPLGAIREHRQRLGAILRPRLAAEAFSPETEASPSLPAAWLERVGSNLLPVENPLTEIWLKLRYLYVSR